MHTSERKSGRKHWLGLAVCIGMLAGIGAFSGCHRQIAVGQTSGNSSADPADVNMAPVDDGQQDAAVPATAHAQNVQNESQQRADEYRRTGAQAGAPPDQQNAPQNDQPDQAAYPQNNDQSDQSYAGDQNDQNYDDQVDAGQQAIEEADQPPPPLPVYVQPEAPGPNYIWTPGYWSYAPTGYYWVPGAWVAAPYDGALWTPGYWAFYGGRYRFYRGYWGLHIGFYGGVHYGFGYTGTGYHGGYWNGNRFYYNRAVNHINSNRITAVYNYPVRMDNNSRIAYNGGRGGIQARPNRSELVAMRGPKSAPMTTQLRMRQQASQNRQQFYNQNRGRPANAVVAQPLSADQGIRRPVARPGQRSGQRFGQPSGQTFGQPNQIRSGRTDQPNRIENRPNQPQVRPVQPGFTPGRSQERSVQPQVRPDQPQAAPNQPQRWRPDARSEQPQIRQSEPGTTRPEMNPSQPNRQYQPGTEPQQRQQRSIQQEQARPEQSQRQYRSEPRSQPQPRAAETSRPQSRPEATPQSRPQPREMPRNDNRQPH